MRAFIKNLQLRRLLSSASKNERRRAKSLSGVTAVHDNALRTVLKVSKDVIPGEQAKDRRKQGRSVSGNALVRVFGCV
jgi:hypothetical protein